MEEQENTSLRGIAFVAPAGSGKSTASHYLYRRRGFQRLSFAGALKEECASALASARANEKTTSTEENWSHHWAEWYDHYYTMFLDPHKKKRFRTLLQWWGTEFRRFEDGENYWVNKTEKFINDSHKDAFFTIDDCRFISEWQMLKKHGFLMVGINRDVSLDGEQGSHPSETEQKQIPLSCVVDNTGDIEHFYGNIDALVNMFFYKSNSLQ